MYINIQKENSRAYGFRCEGVDIRFKNFLITNNISLNNKIQEFFNKKDIVLLKGIDVSEKYRGQGLGGELLQEFLKTPCDVFVLISDIKEDNNFDLTDWYSKNGFEYFCESEFGPLMIKIN